MSLVKKMDHVAHLPIVFLQYTHQNLVNKTSFKLLDFNSGVKIIEPYGTSDHRAHLQIIETKLY